MAALLLLLSLVCLAASAALVVLIYVRTRSLFLSVALFFVAAWTMFGSVPLLVAKEIQPGTQITYLETRLFEVKPDSDYLLTLVSYSIFLLALCGIVLLLAPGICGRHPMQKAHWHLTVVRFPHGRLLTVVAVAVAYQWLAVGRLLASSQGPALYLDRAAREGRLEAYVATGSAVAAALGLALALLGSTANGRRTLLVVSAYVGLLASMFYLSWLQGHRRLMLDCLVAFVVACMTLRAPKSRGRRIRWWRSAALFGGVVIAFLAVSVVGVTRGHGSGEDVRTDAMTIGEAVADFGGLVGSWAGTAELYASHISLFGVISHSDVVHSLDFSRSTYEQYALLVNAPSDQGFTFHPVAGWWLLIGPVAPLAAAVVVAAVTLLLLRISRVDPLTLGGALALPALSVSALAIPSILMRGGPEALWGLALEVLILPGVFLIWPWLGLGWEVRRSAKKGPPLGGHERNRVTDPDSGRRSRKLVH